MLKERHNLVKSDQKGVCPQVDEILEKPTSSIAILYRKAEALSRNSLKKTYIESCLLASTDLGKISELLEIREDLIKVYHDFFFDLEEVDRLTKIEHIESVKDSNEMLMKLWALAHGLDFLAWRLGIRVSISPIDGLQDLFSTCIYKAKEAMYASSTSEQGKESVKWTKLSMDLARILKTWVMDSNEAKKDLELALRDIVPDFGGIDLLLEENDRL